MVAQEINPPLTGTNADEYTRRTVRMWWADGLWDFALAGFFTLTAYWAHVWVRVQAFPTWTWPWPFITDEVENPMRLAFLLWQVGILPVWALYTWGAWKAVQALKARWVAPRTGHVRFSFWLPVERRVLIVHILAYLVGVGVLCALFYGVKGGPHLMSAICVAAPVGILFTIGQVYRLPRYRWVALAGLAAGTGLELLTTTPAEYMAGPRSLFEVSPLYGSPALPLIAWTLISIVSGALALAHTLRRPAGER